MAVAHGAGALDVGAIAARGVDFTGIDDARHFPLGGLTKYIDA
jgi:hypothetical protein